MPIPLHSKSIAHLARNDVGEREMDDISIESCDSISSTSHLGNLRSISQGKLLKSSYERHKKRGNNESKNRNSKSTIKHPVSHDSIELLSSSCVRSLAQRRQTLAAIPKRHEPNEQENEANMEMSLLPRAVDPNHSPQTVGVLQYKTNSNCRKPYKPRYSINNADVSSYRPSKKLVLDAMQEDERESQAE